MSFTQKKRKIGAYQVPISGGGTRSTKKKKTGKTDLGHVRAKTEKKTQSTAEEISKRQTLSPQKSKICNLVYILNYQKLVIFYQRKLSI